MPNEVQLMNAIYRAQPKSMRMVYAQNQKRPIGPIDAFKNRMSSIEDSDRGTDGFRNTMVQYHSAAARSRAREKGLRVQNDPKERKQTPFRRDD